MNRSDKIEMLMFELLEAQGTEPTTENCIAFLEKADAASRKMKTGTDVNLVIERSLYRLALSGLIWKYEIRRDFPDIKV